MAFSVIFNEEGYRKALLNGVCRPTGTITPFIGMKPEAYHSFSQEHGSNGSFDLNLDAVKQRFGKKIFPKITGAVGVTLKYAANFFPTYKFLLKEIFNEEWLAFADWHKFHRDHIIHQPMCIYVGLSLLHGRDFSGVRSRRNHKNRLLLGGKTLLEYCLQNLYKLLFEECEYGYLRNYLEEMDIPAVYLKDTPASRALWKWIFLDTFFLATLFHDIGYPWKFVSDVQEKLTPFSPVKYYIQEEETQALKDDKKQFFSDFLKKFEKQLLFYPLNDYRAPDWKNEEFLYLIEKAFRETHGLPGAISLLYQDFLLQKNSKPKKHQTIHRFCVHWAAMAVMMHDMINFYAKIKEKKIVQINKNLRISPEKDPLSFALTLTDQIQDFARPDAVFKSNGGSTPKVTFRSRCSAVKLDFDEKRGVLEIIYVYKNPNDFIKAFYKFLPKNELLFFEPNKGYLDYKHFSPHLKKITLTAEPTKGINPHGHGFG